MNSREKAHSFDVPFVLILFCTFAIVALSLIAVCAKSYAASSKKLSQNYTLRTALSYIENKLRADKANSVELVQDGETEVLVIGETIGGEVYTTSIYCLDGALYEMFAAAGSDFDKMQGTRILEVSSLSLELYDNLLSVSVSVDTEMRSTFVCLSALGGAR
ncbi:MAG: DUF4860 domain-containing protein [Oscillospiraceae bacterium]